MDAAVRGGDEYGGLDAIAGAAAAAERRYVRRDAVELLTGMAAT